eukprot:358392-Chlamydomonas_euryale.AAC.6
MVACIRLKTAVCAVIRGCCSQGSACVYLHRLPTEPDEQYHKRDIAADIFGREKRAEAEGYRRGAGRQMSVPRSYTPCLGRMLCWSGSNPACR